MLRHLLPITLTNLSSVMPVASAVLAELDCGVTQGNIKRKDYSLSHHRNDGLPMMMTRYIIYVV